MANYRQLFPNLTDADFLAPGAAKTNGNANYIVDWAEHDNTDRIPYAKLPDLSSNVLHTYTFTQADPSSDAAGLASYVASFNANAVQTGGSGYTAGATIAPGDTLVLTVVDSDTTSGGDTGATYSFIYVGASKTAAAGVLPANDIAVGDFRDISDSHHGVTSITAGSGIMVAGVEDDGQFYGNVTISSTPTIAPYVVKDYNTAQNIAAGEIVALGAISAPTTVTLPAAPTAGTSIKFVNFAATHATNVWTIARNSSMIMGQATDLVLDDNTVSFELVFLNATRGWAIVGAN